MKLILFNINEQQRPIALHWAKEHGVEIHFSNHTLTKESAYEAEGFDGIVNSEASNRIDNAVYPILKQFGIRQIAQISAGFDFYDLEEARKNDIIITNVPSYSPESIAEYTVLTALNLVRKSKAIFHRVQEQNYTWDQEIQGSVMGKMKVAIIGTGRIGQMTARIFHGFGCEITGFDVYQNKSLKGILTYCASIEEAVKDADIVSIHIPATSENKHLFNRNMFEKFKTGAIFLNMARGSLVHTEDLLNALAEGKLSGAGLDTYESEGAIVRFDLSQEKIKDETFLALLRNPNIIYSPHIAYFTDEAVKNLVEGGLNAAVEVITTGTSRFRVN